MLCDLPKSVYQVLSYSCKIKTFSATVVKVYFSVFNIIGLSAGTCVDVCFQCDVWFSSSFTALSFSLQLSESIRSASCLLSLLLLVCDSQNLLKKTAKKATSSEVQSLCLYKSTLKEYLISSPSIHLRN